MTAQTDDLNFEIREIAKLLDRSGLRGKAAVFGVCGRALAPLLSEAKQRTEMTHHIPDIVPMLELIEAFATGAMDAAEYGDLRAQLMAGLPHGDDLDAPWSTYVQDALICADAGLAAASLDADFKSIWIEYPLEPLLASMQIRDVEVIRLHGYNYWEKRALGDPVLVSALAFLRSLIEKSVAGTSISKRGLTELVREAAVLLPVAL